MTTRRPASAPPRVLLTGFEPFGGETVNPSWEAVRALRGRRIGGHRIEVARLPTAFGDALTTLDAALAATRPRRVIAVGQAGGRERLSLERIAINVDDARIPDNRGRQPIDQPVIAGAPAAYFSTLPIKAALAALTAAGIPAEISQSAGTYVCNHVFYGLMHALAQRRGARGGFVHIPFLPAQAAAHRGAPSMTLEMVIAALRLIIAVSLHTGDDARIAAGATH